MKLFALFFLVAVAVGVPSEAEVPAAGSPRPIGWKGYWTALRSLLVTPDEPFFTTRFAEPVSLTGRHAVVTGFAPGSLGLETAKALAQWGRKLS